MEVQNEIRIAQSLLSQVDTIIKKHDEIAQIRGEKFNIFEILGLEWKETQLHSKMLAHLLDPKGSHGMGSRFLETFITDVLEMDLEDFECTGAMVEIEKSFYADGQELSRIDILIMPAVSTQQHIIIENKTTAVDQDRQLRRYHSYRPNGREPKLVYLTRFGREPSPQSIGEMDPKLIISISYRTDILNWIEQKCLPATYDQYGLNRVLQQYALSIKNITNQSRTKEMENELSKILAQEQNVNAAFLIAGSIESMKKDLFDQVLLSQLDKLILHKNLLPFTISEGYQPTEGGSLSARYINSYYHVQAWYYPNDFLVVINLEDYSNDLKDLDACNKIWEEEGKELYAKLNETLGTTSAIRTNTEGSWQKIMWAGKLTINFSSESDRWLAMADGTIARKFKEEFEKVIRCLDEYFAENTQKFFYAQ